MLCCGYTLTDFPISIRLTSLALWQSNDCPSASKTTLMNMDKYFMWIHYERLHNHNKAKHNKTVCIFLGIYCMISQTSTEARDRAVNVRGCLLWTTMNNLPTHRFSKTFKIILVRYHMITYPWGKCLCNVYYKRQLIIVRTTYTGTGCEVLSVNKHQYRISTVPKDTMSHVEEPWIG